MKATNVAAPGVVIVNSMGGAQPVTVPIETSPTIGRPRRPVLDGRRCERARSTLAVMCAYEGVRYAQAGRCIAPGVCRSRSGLG